jgi:hypothetical protein
MFIKMAGIKKRSANVMLVDVYFSAGSGNRNNAVHAKKDCNALLDCVAGEFTFGLGLDAEEGNAARFVGTKRACGCDCDCDCGLLNSGNVGGFTESVDF